MEAFQLPISGISQGCVYGLIALGFVLIYKATEMVNFAQGDMMMFGAYVAFTYINLAGMPFFRGAARRRADDGTDRCPDRARDQLELKLRNAYHYASDVMVRNMLTEEANEGIGEFLDKRRQRWSR